MLVRKSYEQKFWNAPLTLKPEDFVVIFNMRRTTFSHSFR